jgi:hypothetical protein
MKTASRFLALFIFAGLWMVGCQPSLVQKLYEAGLIQDDYRYGDLYRLSNLPQFKQKIEPCSSAKLSTQAVHLYIIGDSFTEPTRVDSSTFVAQQYTYLNWDAAPKTIKLDTNVTNILLFQTVERHLRDHLAKPIHNFEIQQTPLINTVQNQLPIGWVAEFEKIQKNINERLESFLFSGDFFLWFKEQKARFNHYFFDRTNHQVTVTKDGKHLLFDWDTDSSRSTSSFSQLSDDELNKIVTVANNSRNHYLEHGFDEVLLSVVPNKTSIVAPDLGLYNHALERFQLHPQLQVPLIDIWSDFSTNATQVYYKSDTHWNCKGQQMWVDKVNTAIRQAAP